MSAIVTMPVRFGLPNVPSIHARCQRCQAGVWLSRRARLGDDDVVICVVCAMAIVKPGDVISAAAWLLEDLADLINES